MKRLGFAMLVLILGLACTTASAAAEATTVSGVVRYPWSSSATTCSGESVTASGTALLVYHQTYDAAGQSHLVYHLSGQGFMARTADGKPLPVVSTYQEVSSFTTPSEGGVDVHTIVNMGRSLIGDGTVFTYRTHATFTANGDLVAFGEVLVEELCP